MFIMGLGVGRKLAQQLVPGMEYCCFVPDCGGGIWSFGLSAQNSVSSCENPEGNAAAHSADDASLDCEVSEGSTDSVGLFVRYISIRTREAEPFVFLGKWVKVSCS